MKGYTARMFHVVYEHKIDLFALYFAILTLDKRRKRLYSFHEKPEAKLKTNHT